MENYMCIDTETGGTNPKLTDVLQIGIIFVKDNKVVQECEFNVKHDVYRVTPEAMKVNQINLVEREKNKENLMTPTEIKGAITRLANHIYKGKKVAVLGHNVNFDLGFIYEGIMEKNEWEALFSYRTVDTASISRFLIDAKKLPSLHKNDLSSLMVYFNLGDELSEERHTAIFDARCTMKIYNKFLEIMKEDK